jgi:hypothetical protein
VQNPSDGALNPLQVSYVVVERGAWEIDGFRFEAQSYSSTVTDSDTSWVGEARAYGQAYTNPVVVGQVMTANDPDWSVFWASSNVANNPPTALQLRTGKHVGEDADTTRANETVGFIVFEAAHGILDGTEFEARVGPNSVAGVGDAPPYLYTFATPFAVTPTVGVASVAGMNGTNNGGWAQLHGASPLTTTQISLSMDEDQIADAARSHTNEEVAYLVFAPGP